MKASKWKLTLVQPVREVTFRPEPKDWELTGWGKDVPTGGDSPWKSHYGQRCQMRHERELQTDWKASLKILSEDP